MSDDDERAAQATGSTTTDLEAPLSQKEPAPTDSVHPLLPIGPGLGLSAIGPIGADRKAREWALVLQSMSTWFVLQRTAGTWYLLVRDADHAAAEAAIQRYELENRDWPPRETPERLRHAGSPIAALLFAALAAFVLVTGAASGGSRWFQRGASISDLVLSTQPWRAVTALTLHADSVHVMGNVISGAIFASAVQRRLGPGGAALAILASGIAGNVANAVFHHAMGDGGHGSIGASTAVFGAVGILAATQVAVDHRRIAGAKRRVVDVVAPLVGGLALLGALGASPNADLGAHLFGLLAGALIGVIASIRLRRELVSPRWWVQTAFGAVTAAVILGSWRLAMAR